MGTRWAGDKCDKGLHICMKCWKKDHGAMQAATVQPVASLGQGPAPMEEGQGDVLKLADISDCVQKREKVSPCALELFAGSCELSKCLKSHGFAAFGIDHQKCKNRVGPCVVMDLTKKSSRKFILTMLSTGKVAAVPMAPPCGTSSSKRKTPSSSSAPARSSRAKTTAQCSVSIGVPTVDGQGVAESKIGKRLLRNGVADLPRVPSTRYTMFRREPW